MSFVPPGGGWGGYSSYGAPPGGGGGYGAPPGGGGYGAPPGSGYGAPPGGGGYGAPPGGGGYGGPPGGSSYGPPPGYGGPPPGAGGPPPGYGAPPGAGGPPPGYGGPPPGAGGPPPGYGAPPGQRPPAPGPSGSFTGQWYGALYNSMSPAEIEEHRRWFSQIDKDGSGSITPAELQNLAFGGKPLGFETAVKLTKIFDRDRSGSIDFYEYATLHKFITSMQHSFGQTDTDRSGTLDANEIVRALAVSGFTLSPAAVAAIHRKYNKRGGGVTFPDFLAIAADIALLRTQFERIDQTRSGVIHIDLNTLIIIASEI